MRIKPERYDTKVAAWSATQPSRLIADVTSFTIDHGVEIRDNEAVIDETELRVNAVIKHPDKLAGKYFFARISSADPLTLWDDIDPDWKCFGNLDWLEFENYSVSLSAHCTASHLERFIYLCIDASKVKKMMVYVSP